MAREKHAKSPFTSLTLPTALVLSAAMTLAGGATAQDAKEKAPAAAADKAPAAGQKRVNQVPKDPKGVSGISPFWEAVKRGDDAFIARDLDGALNHYTDALKSEPQNAFGHYRVAEVHIAKEELPKAIEALDSALRFAGSQQVLKAKILFLQADVRERAQNLSEAQEKWTAYENFAKAQPGAKAYPATAADRKRRIEQVEKLKEQYAAVKERIAKREAEIDAKAKGKK